MRGAWIARRLLAVLALAGFAAAPVRAQTVELAQPAPASALELATAPAPAPGSAPTVLPSASAASMRPDKPAAAAPAADSRFSGDVSGGYSQSREGYVTREYWFDGDVNWRYRRDDLTAQWRFKRGYVRDADLPKELAKDRFDTHFKYRHFDEERANYAYVSPRLRHNAFGYFRDSQALRLGVGHELHAAWVSVLALELGTGYRRAKTSADQQVHEVLTTVSTRLRVNPWDGVRLGLDFVNERSAGERYRTVDAWVRTRLMSHLGLKYAVSYGSAYPFDAQTGGSELTMDLSLSYEF